MPGRNTEPHDFWKLYMPISVTAPLEVLLIDPVTKKPKYGARSQLVANLLRRYLYEIGWYDSDVPIVKRKPLTPEQLEAIVKDIPPSPVKGSES